MDHLRVHGRFGRHGLFGGGQLMFVAEGESGQPAEEARGQDRGELALESAHVISLSSKLMGASWAAAGKGPESSG
jgi:hypothetical protein